MNPPKRRLVVNADDAGLHEATDRAILRCFEQGVVRSASVVAGGPTTEAFVERAARAGLDLGLHVNLTEGRALTGPIEGLTDAGGAFLGTAHKAEIVARLFEEPLPVGDEIRAQWNRLRALGIEPTHLDGHNHVHLAPCAAGVVAELAPQCFVRRPIEPDGRGPRWFPVEPTDLPLGRCMQAYLGHAYSIAPELAVVRAGLEACRGTIEWMVHPGRRPGSAFTDNVLRAREVELLCSAGLRTLLDALDCELTSFQSLLKSAPA